MTASASAASHLIDWLAPISKATAKDIHRFGPNAARVRSLLRSVPVMDYEARRVADSASYRRSYKTLREYLDDWESVMHDTNNVDLGHMANVLKSSNIAANRRIFSNALNNAAIAEMLADSLGPETYRVLTEPMAVGTTLQRKLGLLLPDQQGQFMQMVNQLRPASVEDIIAMERLSGNPNVDAMLEMLGAMSGSQPLARKINAVETLWRSGRGGRGMQ